MTDVATHPLVGRLVRYVGNNRESLYDLIGVVEKVNGNSAAVRYADGQAEVFKNGQGLVWAALWAWAEIEPAPTKGKILNDHYSIMGKTDDLDALFTEAAGGKLAVAKNEIKRLEAELAKLRTFVEVYESL